MKSNKMLRYFMLLAVILSVGFGCKFIKANKTNDIEEIKQKTETEITKAVLKERLSAKGVKMASVKTNNLKPNPLTLHLKFATRNNNFQLNRENYDNFSDLADKLKEIFKSREENGVFKEGTNEVYKTITLPAAQELIDEYNSKGIYVEDFEKLVDDLQNEGFDQIELDTNEENFVESIEILPTPKRLNDKNDSPPTNSKNIKTISGGVLNGKAKNLVQPTYPAAAKAVRASGAVNVQVTIDEKGNVISASAVSGHPLLRASAVEAAKASTFSPTLLSGEPVRVTGVIVYNFKPE